MSPCLPVCLMVSERIFSCTCTGTWCYINRRSLVLAQTLEVIRSSLVLAHLHRRVLAQTLHATLQGAGYRGGTIPSGGGGVPGRRPGPYIRIYYTQGFSLRSTRKAKATQFWVYQCKYESSSRGDVGLYIQL